MSNSSVAGKKANRSLNKGGEGGPSVSEDPVLTADGIVSCYKSDDIYPIQLTPGLAVEESGAAPDPETKHKPDD